MKICKIYFSLLFSCFLALFVLSVKFLLLEYSILLEIELMEFNSVKLVMVVLFDWMSLLFMSFVLLISSLVIYYSDEYMHGDKTLNRFIMLVVMFVLSMMLLIISPNLVSILLGWDGLGLVSYCLVIYYQNIRSFNAGMLTVLSNRIGDVAFLMSIAWMMNFGSWNYIFYLTLMKNDFIMQLIMYLMILAAMTKSAQIPFSSWLPAAMAAPTPVSSLVHSSTLVTAGVYLLIRFNFAFNDLMLYILLFFASLTMFMSGMSANFEYDLKKIIALSTLSQLGLMLSVLALGSYKLAFFHLLTHALFKALLFMCAGVIIHNLMDCQDIRFMGGLVNHMPLTCAYFNICNLSLCGLPFLSGFYSKDLIVEFMMMNYLNVFIYLIFYLSLGLTVAYSLRLTYYTMISENNYISLNCLDESGYIMLKGMSGLIMLVIFMGSFLNWMIFIDPIIIILPFFLKIMTLIFIIFGALIGYELAKFKLNFFLKGLFFKNFSFFYFYMWNLVILSTLGVNYYPIYMGEILYKKLDQGWFEYYGAKNLLIWMQKFTKMLQLLSINHLSIYFMLMLTFYLFCLII
uniref:NADH dehydrogenase subunit 5 n=1 Tax=Oulema tristis TaxID=2824129 RepID=UPI00226D0093|nr:NADH dehydrogenase subunit 5 [Oulema tristis]UZN44095.1 NADH dehydrogenase subunit 5 [Oulema tristis]